MRAKHLRWTRHHPKPAHYFRIYAGPDRRGLFVHVEVYRTVGDLRRTVRADRHLKDDGQPYRTRGLVGMCTGIVERRLLTKRKCASFTVVRLAANACRTATIVHEMFHATCRWAERRGIASLPLANTPKPRGTKRYDCDEERMATVHDRLCRQLINRLFDVKVLR